MGSRLERGPSLWYSHAQIAHSTRNPRARTPLPLPLPQGARGGGSQPEGGGFPVRRGVGVPARGVLQAVRRQEAWEFHQPGTPYEPGPLTFSQLLFRVAGQIREIVELLIRCPFVMSDPLLKSGT